MWSRVPVWYPSQHLCLSTHWISAAGWLWQSVPSHFSPVENHVSQPDFLSMSDLQERCSRCELNSTLDNGHSISFIYRGMQCCVFSLALWEKCSELQQCIMCSSEIGRIQCSPDALASEIDDRCCYSDFCILGRGSTIVYWTTRITHEIEHAWAKQSNHCQSIKGIWIPHSRT